MENDIKGLQQKLLELKKIVSILQKDSKGYGYDYVSEEKILLAVNDKMIEFGLRLTPKLKPNTLHSEVISYTNDKGKLKTDVLVRSEMIYEWLDTITGEIECIDWGLIGQQSDGSQAFGSGLTYSNRYFLLKFFNIATSSEDPDLIRKKKAEEEEKKKISLTQTKIKKLFDKALKIYQKSKFIYEKLGTTKEQFQNDYNDENKNKVLLEQLELILKDDGVNNA